MVTFCDAGVIQGGANIDLEDREGGRTPLYWAAFQGSDRVRVLFLSTIADPDTIHLNAIKGNLPKVKDFIKSGVDVNARDQFGCTPLLWAVRAKNNEVAEYLVAQGADVNAKDKHGLCPLLGAKRLDMIQLLVSRGADLEAKDTTFGYTALNAACTFGNDLDSATFLMDQGANVNTRNNWGITPLIGASMRGNVELVERLIAKDANINMKYWNGTPLTEAAAAGHIEVVRGLLAKGANIKAKNNRGETALSKAEKNGHTDIVSLLRQHGATSSAQAASSPNGRSRPSTSALEQAILANDLDKVKELIAQGADVNLRDSRGNTPLLQVIKTGQLSLVEPLIAAGADVNAKDRQGKFALYLAKEKGYRELEAILTEARIAQIKRRQPQSKTVQEEIIEMLIKTEQEERKE